jgi:hypothetical protein
MPFMPAAFTADGPDTLLRLKVVPGASRDAIAGLLGDRLKIRISTPPEGGKANKAICQMLARALQADVRIEAGHGSPLKTTRAAGISPDQVADALDVSC